MLGDRLRQARRARGWSLEELAEKAGSISRQAIHYYETGQDTPGSSVLLRLANALGVGIDYFFRTITVNLGTPAYRAHCQLPARERRRIESLATEEIERYIQAESFVEPGKEHRLNLPDSVGNAVESAHESEPRAEAIREHWQIGLDPINNMTELLEDNGIKVIYVEADVKFDGCAYVDGDVTAILVNRGKPGDRQRFDLAHELAHIALRFPDSWTEKQQEEAAHRFAGAFLAPAAAVRKELGTKRVAISIVELQILKKKYGMSMQAWIHRAMDLGIISKSAASKLYREFSARGWRIKEPGPPYPEERSYRLEGLVARAVSSGIVSDTKAAELLGKPLDEYLACMVEADEDSAYQLTDL